VDLCENQLRRRMSKAPRRLRLANTVSSVGDPGGVLRRHSLRMGERKRAAGHPMRESFTLTVT
jgi:hypothetical protein